MTNERPLVSVVTPVHDTARFIDDCIQSVLRQSYTNFEYIIVENQSTDGTGEIADGYAALDPRVRVIRTDELLPQVENYNYALNQISASSRYTKMCQADDWLLDRCLEEMVALGTRNPTVGLISSYAITGTRIENVGLPISASVVDGRRACELYLRDRLYLFGTPTTVMYRSDLVRSRPEFYAPGRLHEDTEVCFELLANADFGFVHQVLSVCREREDSITSSESDLLPEALDRLIVVKTHGRRYLGGAELREADNYAVNEYYRGLARRVLRRIVVPHDDSFWAYQSRGLALAGESLNYGRLFVAIASVIIEGILSPLAMIEKVRSVLLRRRSQRSRAVDDQVSPP